MSYYNHFPAPTLTVKDSRLNLRTLDLSLGKCSDHCSGSVKNRHFLHHIHINIYRSKFRILTEVGSFELEDLLDKNYRHNL